MDDNNWIFTKLPNWLRWILALPVAILASLILPTLASISNYLVFGGDTNGILIKLFEMWSSVGGFLYGLIYCVPKHKVIISSVTSILFSIYFSIMFVLNGLQSNWLTANNIVNLASAGICIFVGVNFLLNKEAIEPETEDSTFTG